MTTTKDLSWLLFSVSVGIVSSTGKAYAAPLVPITGTLTGQYFVVNPSDPDFFQGDGLPAHATLNNLVQSTLGPNGLPVYNPASGYNFANDRTANGEITWWSPPLNPNVSVSPVPTSTVNLPFDSSRMFPPAPDIGTSDVGQLLTAHFTGSFNLAFPETLFVTLGSDDDAFFYLDGDVISQIGGVHPFTIASTAQPFTVSSGQHTIDVFYADRESTQARLLFELSHQGISVPEPDIILLFGTGLLMLLGANHRRRLQKT